MPTTRSPPSQFSHAASAQPPTDVPEFKNAAVHVAAPGGRDTAIGRFDPGARFEINGFTMLDLVVRAYGVSDPDCVVGGPVWIGFDKFDIVAEVPNGVRAAAMRPMLQKLLADRFRLVVHRDQKPMPLYTLVAGKRVLFKESAGGASQCQTSGWELTTMVCTNIGMEQFARELYNHASGYFDRPLADRTGLTGGFDLALHWTPSWQIAAHDTGSQSADISALDAVDKQLGLKVVTTKETVSVLVIDHVNRTSTPNAPGVAAALLAPTLVEFEVAEVRPHKPGSPFKYATYDTEADILGLSLRNLIYEAYGYRGQELVVPKWVDTEPFEVIAKAPRRVPWENMQVMLQNLIEQRFKLTYRKEDRAINAYALTVGKRTARLKDGDPNTRSDCRKAAGGAGMMLTCRNTTMAQFAEKASSLTGDFPPIPVADLTGLKGGFDFSVTWMPAPRQNPGEPAADAGQATGSVEATAPTGRLTFFEALDKQLGLKLQQQKLPMPVMVVDHVERPAEN
jgi:uncharacterized protein (TIGR03435 family)